ncbi:hypothetical protein DL546_004475 [Coniochaeta pulveracea]|uniref:Conidiation-specific protein 6 n=1 Tax=Coniochaeta pulveracea TaxID=177199 RepID=A0A420YFA2_9PEZI|nr:hypothetical protein DL546_004475 [Coniochaeta pulveracea]
MARSSQVAGGHKANLNNPNTSEESKKNSKQALENEFDDNTVESDSEASTESKSSKDDHEKNPNNVAGGLKATLKNPNVSDEAKQSAQERLDKMEQ